MKFSNLCSEIFKGPNVTPSAYTPSDLTLSKTSKNTFFTPHMSCSLNKGNSKYGAVGGGGENEKENKKPNNNHQKLSYPLPLDQESPFMIPENPSLEQLWNLTGKGVLQQQNIIPSESDSNLQQLKNPSPINLSQVLMNKVRRTSSQKLLKRQESSISFRRGLPIKPISIEDPFNVNSNNSTHQLISVLNLDESSIPHKENDYTISTKRSILSQALLEKQQKKTLSEIRKDTELKKRIRSLSRAKEGSLNQREKAIVLKQNLEKMVKNEINLPLQMREIQQKQKSNKNNTNCQIDQSLFDNYIKRSSLSNIYNGDSFQTSPDLFQTKLAQDKEEKEQQFSLLTSNSQQSNETQKNASLLKKEIEIKLSDNLIKQFDMNKNQYNENYNKYSIISNKYSPPTRQFNSNSEPLYTHRPAMLSVNTILNSENKEPKQALAKQDTQKKMTKNKEVTNLDRYFKTIKKDQGLKQQKYRSASTVKGIKFKSNMADDKSPFNNNVQQRKIANKYPMYQSPNLYHQSYTNRLTQKISNNSANGTTGQKISARSSQSKGQSSCCKNKKLVIGREGRGISLNFVSNQSSQNNSSKNEKQKTSRKAKNNSISIRGVCQNDISIFIQFHDETSDKKQDTHISSDQSESKKYQISLNI